MISIKWQQRFMKLAHEVSTWSKDPSTKVGAVIVDAFGRILATGYNGYPRGVPDRRITDREYKLMRTVHAEINALLYAPVHVRGCALFCTNMPCSQCAGAIIQSGIIDVYTHMPHDEGYRERWLKELAATDNMFNESGVHLFFI